MLAGTLVHLSGISQLEALSNLQRLNLARIGLCSSQLEPLNHLTGLTYLDLAQAQVQIRISHLRRLSCQY